MRLVTGILSACGLMICACVSAQDIRIENVTVVSPERDRPLTKATVVIREDRIVSVGSVASGTSQHSGQIIDGTGLFLAPGLIDSHVHLGEVHGMTVEQQQANPDLVKAGMEQMPRSFLYFGYTTVLDLTSTRERARPWPGPIRAAPCGRRARALRRSPARKARRRSAA